MIYALRNCLLATILLVAIVSAANQTRLAGIYVKDGSQNGQLRFLASGLTSSSSTASGSNSLNSALNQYITNKQDMLEQLRPTSNSGTGLTSVTGSTGNNNAIYVNLASGTVNSGISTTSTTGTGTGTGTSTATGTGTGNSNAQAALNQVIYGSTPINSLLPQVIGQAVAQRRRPGNNNRRRVVKRRRPAGNNNNNTRRRRKGNKKAKKGNKRPQVLVVRPSRG